MFLTCEFSRISVAAATAAAATVDTAAAAAAVVLVLVAVLLDPFGPGPVVVSPTDAGSRNGVWCDIPLTSLFLWCESVSE